MKIIYFPSFPLVFKSEHMLFLSFLFFRIGVKENKVKIGNWRRIADARQFIFFTQFSARIQFSEYGKPILSFFIE